MELKDFKLGLHRVGSEKSIFEISDEDTSSSTLQYFGYLNAEGYWVIQERDSSGATTTYRYASGTSGYSAGWVARAGLVYALYTSLFSS